MTPLMSKSISVRVAHRQPIRAGGQNKHDLRRGHQPSYVDGERTHQNSVLIAPQSAAELRKECEQRRSARQTCRAMKRNAAVATVGIITFSHEAQSAIEALSVEEQNRRFLETAKALASSMGTTLTGLVVHRDESAIHAHFQCPAVRLDGNPVSKTLGRGGTSQLQDVGATAWADLGIARGERKADKVARLEQEGKTSAEIRAATIHRSVAELHHDLPVERDALSKSIAEDRKRAAAEREAIAEELAALQAKADKNRRLIDEQQTKLAAGRVSEEQARKRIETYERREKAALEKCQALAQQETAAGGRIDNQRKQEIDAAARVANLGKTEAAITERVTALQGAILGEAPPPPEPVIITQKTGAFSSRHVEVIDAAQAKDWIQQIQEWASQGVAARTLIKEQEIAKREAALQTREQGVTAMSGELEKLRQWKDSVTLHVAAKFGIQSANRSKVWGYLLEQPTLPEVIKAIDRDMAVGKLGRHAQYAKLRGGTAGRVQGVER